MIGLIIGPSGAGKSTAKRELSSRHEISLLKTFTDREQRDGEYEKITVPKLELDLYTRGGLFHHIQNVNGRRYAQLASEVDIARNVDSHWWLMDISFDQLSFWASDADLVICILPESENSLVTQLEFAGRPDRIEGALEDLRTNYSHEKLKALDKKYPFILIKNEYAAPTQMVDLIAKKLGVGN